MAAEADFLEVIGTKVLRVFLLAIHNHPQYGFNVNIVYGNKSENSQDYTQKPQRNCTFMNSASGRRDCPHPTCRNQREGMGPQEYQAMPSSHEVTHDGWLFSLLNNSSWKFHQLAAGQLLPGQPVRYGKGRRYGPSITYKITPAGSLSSSQPGGPPCWASPLVFGLTGRNRKLSLQDRVTMFMALWCMVITVEKETKLCL